MDVILERIEPMGVAFERLRNAPLQAAQGKEIFAYSEAKMHLMNFYPEELNPSTLYVIRERLEIQRALRRTLLERYQINLFELPGILHLNVSGKNLSLAPPFVEIYEEEVQIVPHKGDRTPPGTKIKIAILIDGIHRAWIARENDAMIRCAVISNASKEFLQYAYPNSWSNIVVCDKIPRKKKNYRRQDPYSFMAPISAFRGDNPEWNRK